MYSRENILVSINQSIKPLKERIKIFFSTYYVMEPLFSEINKTMPLVKKISILKRIIYNKTIIKKQSKSTVSISKMDNKLYLISTKSHVKVLKEYEKGNIKFYENMNSLLFPLYIVFKTFFFGILDVSYLFFTKFPDKEIKKALNKLFFYGSLNYIASLYHYFKYYYTLSDIIKTDSDIKKIIYFTDGPIGFAVRDICKKYLLQSCFIQHGILYNFYLPIKFNEIIFYSPWDKKFFEKHLGKIENYSYYVSKEKILNHKNITTNKLMKTALWALEYIPSGYYYTKESRISEIKEYINIFKKYSDWKLIIRPHPNDPDDWYNALISENVIFDKYIGDDINNSLIKNNILISISFHSTALLDSLINNCLPVAIYSKTWDMCNIDFNVFCYTVKNNIDMEALLKNNINQILNIVEEKKKALVFEYK